ncbi:SUMF1/EgtB/PvdO family nonheme iron enzyme [Sorangium sp. So ce295]|jgi:formylglycine-generating enzyme required for sulfatase activity|uniref:formylglycine-generating enzyme family protein n=1 Tax=Sorangium sp. So ce295 TaxID=3133295 RepID=UPI003F608F75
MVPGGTFNRGNDPAFPAMVSGFLLDRFEVTVGRFRRFVEAYPGSKPAPGAGAHPLIEGSGWDAVEFASHLPAGAPELTAAVRCNANFSTWTDEIGDHEHLPMNCLSWSVAFAFCAWDGGRLATEAEWNYAAAGGDEQRVYPWATPPGSSTIDGTYAAYNCMGDGSASGECALSDIQSVGSRSPKGDGKWGHADLAGSLQEWVLDWYDYNYKSPCNDCAQVSGLPYKMIRGGSWRRDASYLLSSYRKEVDADNCSDSGGVRCARTP